MSTEKNDILAFHEKIYYYELDCREKIISRLQLNLAILTGFIGIAIYIVARFDLNATPGPLVFGLFAVSFTIGIILISVSILKFIQALWGHDYECLPTAVEVENYRNLLVSTYEENTDGEQIAADYYLKFLLKYYSDCSTKNATQNSLRYDLLHESLSYVVFAIPFVVIFSLIFILGGLCKITPA